MEESRFGPVSIAAYVTGTAELATRVYNVAGPPMTFECPVFDSLSDPRCGVVVGFIAVVWFSALVLHAAMLIAWWRNRAPHMLERGLWLLLAIAGFPLGAVIYFFVIYRNLDSNGQYCLQTRA